MKRKVALITGVGGQDGSYLAEFLLDKGYLVRGIIRRASLPNTKRFEHLVLKYGASDEPNTPFRVEYADLTDAQSIRKVIDKFRPDEIYNLGAQSHVGISFDNAESTININTLGPLRILEILRQSYPHIKYYQASSSEMFGIAQPPQNESTVMLPQSPYGIAKLAAYHLTRLYRNAYGLFACNGILFNHESPRRGFNFVTKKITKELAKIVAGEIDKITLGNLDAKRDWGYSKEYIEVMWAILQHDRPDDFVIATEETHTVRDFLKESFDLVGLKYEDYLEVSDKFHRPAEVPALLGDAKKAKVTLNWSPKVKFKELVYMMVEADLKEKLEEAGILPIQPGVVREKGYYLNKAKEILSYRQNNKNIESLSTENN
ncbi:GDP-mannose 4,6-dehydratase [Candidatus Pacearchaeota archaeon]|nr:GDP-mannose 4,6-dehydratase [Candidatus Pacearchaeota archaeon]